jgi:hypothetical protein
LTAICSINIYVQCKFWQNYFIKKKTLVMMFFLSKKTFGRGTKFTKIIGCITYAQERILLEDLYILKTILD